MCKHGVFLGCTHCVVNMHWFNLCQGCSSNTPFTHGVVRFLNWHIYCSMQPTISMWNTLPSIKPTWAKVGFPHINAHHTNIVGWEKGSKRDIPEIKTALPKGKNTLASERWNWRVLTPKKKLGQIYEPLVNMMRRTFMVSFLADSCFCFPVTSGQMRSTCFHISQFWS
jgi:hypothetical protein